MRKVAADLYVIPPRPPEEAPSAARAAAGERADVKRLVTAGTWLAVAAGALQIVVHFVNAATFAFSELDVNEEHNIFTWANSSAILAVAVAASLAALLGEERRRQLLALAVCTTFLSVDEAVVLHENITFAVLGALDLGDVYDSVLWPILYLPLLLLTAVLLLRVGRPASPRGRRCVLVGLALLAFSVFLEIVSTPWSTERNLIHTIEGGFEETAELAGWILIATGLAALVAQPLERSSRITRLSRS